MVATNILQSVSHAEKKVGTATSRVIKTHIVCFGNIDLNGNNLCYERDNIFGGVLFSGGLGRDVSPLALDVFFKRGNVGIVVWREVNLCSTCNILHEHSLLAKLCLYTVKVEILTIFGATLNTEKFFNCGVETVEIGLKILLKSFVVVAD